MTGDQTFELGAATHADLPVVLELLRDCALLETGVAEAFGAFVVARSPGELVGCAGLEVYGELGLLRSVAVRPAARSAGLGSALVASIEGEARRRALRELYLLTTTAAPFFQKRGFASVSRTALPPEIAQSWEFRVGCPQTAQALYRTLGPRP